MTAARHAPPDHWDLLLCAYAAYDAQDVDALMALVSDDVDWPDGPGGAGRLHGKEQVRAYWEEQWTRTRTHDEPSHSRKLDDGRAGAGSSGGTSRLGGIPPVIR